MKQDEALRIGRKAVDAARKQVGDKKEELTEEMQRKLEAEPQLSEALAQTGFMVLQSSQETRH